jgi:hypothetical protein
MMELGLEVRLKRLNEYSDLRVLGIDKCIMAILHCVNSSLTSLMCIVISWVLRPAH